MGGDTTAWVGLRLDPLDTLFFRDGRPFDAANRVSGGLPVPQTLAGALRTALLARTGFRFEEFAAKRKKLGVRDALRQCGADPTITDASFRGPWLALADSDKRVEPLFPIPTVLTRAKDATQGWSRARPLTPKAVPGWDNHPDGLWPLWREVEADPKAEADWLTFSGLQQFLTGEDPGFPQRVVERAEVYDFDNRIGIEIEKHTLTSDPGKLYGIRLLSFRDRRDPEKRRDHCRETRFADARRVCLYAEVQIDADRAENLSGAAVPFGGEGKHVVVSVVPGLRWPSVDDHCPRSLWYLATPTFLPFRGEWKRPLPAGIGLRAAASSPGVAVSGWDVALNGPRPTRFAVPAGAVYFVDGPCGPTAFLDAGNEQETTALFQEGWGFALPGKWEDQRG